MSDGAISAILRTPGHDRNGAAVTDFPKNPFKPGAGRVPAYMGHRPEVEGVLSRFLQTLRDGRPDTELGFLYGPRGNGKTVLLQWLERKAGRRSEGRPIIQVRISRTQMNDPFVVAQKILNAISGSGGEGEWSVEASVKIPLVGSVQATRNGESRVLSLEEILSEETDPLLLTLDEAHEAPPEMLGGLLDVVQIAGSHRPIAAVFAGTPDLETALLEARSSFWSRGRKLRIGLLSDESAREVLARPFQDAGLEAQDEAIAELAATADNYPYFLQLYGEAAWSVVEASGGKVFLPKHVAPTVAAANGVLRDYYNDRFREFSVAKWLPLAREVAEAFVASAGAPADRSLPDAALREILAGHGDVEEAMRFLAAKGYVWRDRQGDHFWTPGIPSLMDYMTERIPTP